VAVTNSSTSSDNTRRPSRLYRTPEAARYLKEAHDINRAPAYLAKLRVVGGGPEFVYVGRWPAYPEPALDAYAANLISRPMRSTSEAA
jgi:hypothetical protein